MIYLHIFADNDDEDDDDKDDDNDDEDDNDRVHPGGELQNIGQLFPAAQTVHHRFPLLPFYLKEKYLF